jgi:hypothetical protein
MTWVKHIASAHEYRPKAKNLKRRSCASMTVGIRCCLIEFLRGHATEGPILLFLGALAFSAGASQDHQLANRHHTAMTVTTKSTMTGEGFRTGWGR